MDEAIGQSIYAKLQAEIAKHMNSLRRRDNYEDPVSFSREVPDSVKRRKKDQKVKCPFALGLRQVTRMLDRDQIGLVFVCKDDLACPQLVQHLPFQCRLKGIPVVPLPVGSSSQLASTLGINDLSVIGVRKVNDGTDSETIAFVENIKEAFKDSVSPLQLQLSKYQDLTIKTIAIPKPTPKNKKNSNNTTIKDKK